MKRPRRKPSALAYALYANAAVLLGILLVLLFGNRSVLTAPALGAPLQEPPIAGGAGIFVMPAQFHSTVWGCYLMDVDRGTLCTYEYKQGQQALVLTSARNFRYDLMLKQFNTFPLPNEVKKLVDDEAENNRVDAKPPQTPPEAPQDNR
jgi:hypothetical protein